MSAAGWYEDGSGSGVMRWWDGERWTEHTQAPGGAPAGGSAAADEIRVSNKKTTFVADAQRILLHDRVYPLAHIDRVAYKATATRINGAYMGTDFLVKLATPEHSGHFLLPGNHKDLDIDERRAGFAQIVGLLEATVVPRLVARIVETVRAGGPSSAIKGVELGPAGIKARRPLARTIPWAQVVGTERNNIGHMQVLVAKGDHAKATYLLGPEQWNVVLLPYVVAELGGSRRRRD